MSGLRVGSGYDCHRLVADRPLILAGVELEFDRGLEGHSDADVVTHAVIDSLLGAVGLGDIGEHFPDTDPAYAGISSIDLVGEVVALLKKNVAKVVNVDVTVVAEEPKIGPYRGQMTATLAQALALEPSGVSVKATTNEGVGFIGRGEAIAAIAVALVEVAQ